ncbi:MAG: hypothetical protein QOI24_1132 [Acidobacteriota bacterium]|nr:hypothetical protein [Acidobacteriota bacterium]
MREIPAAVLAANMSLEPAPTERVELQAPVIRRVMPRITPPLNLAVIPFRYRVSSEGVEAVRPKCRHKEARSRARS